MTHVVLEAIFGGWAIWRGCLPPMVLAIRRKKDAFAARRLLIEAAWSCRFPARIGHDLLVRQEKLSKSVRDMAWKVQERAFVCLAIAQTKPESSRAIASVITVFSFPACPSLRYRRHSPL